MTQKIRRHKVKKVQHSRGYIIGRRWILLILVGVLVTGLMVIITGSPFNLAADHWIEITMQSLGEATLEVLAEEA